MLRTENWCGYDIRFIEINGEWWAILKDICDALKLRTDGISQRLTPDMLERVRVESSIPSSNGVRYTKTSDHPSKVDRYDEASDIVSNDVRYDKVSDVPSKNLRYEHTPVKTISKAAIGKDIGRRPGDNKTRWMLAVNELGIYEALFASRRLEARKFRMWAGRVMKRLRSQVGLEGYEVMRMTDKDVQDQIDHMLDTLFWDDEKKMLMQSVTIAGGDVDQIPFEI